MAILVRGKAPTRIDLAGGTLDLWPIHHLLDHKVTVNAAVTLEAEVLIKKSAGKSFVIKSHDLELSLEGEYRSVCQTTKLPLLGLLLSAVWNESLPPLVIETKAKSPAGAGLGGSSCLAVTLVASLVKMRRLLSDFEEWPEEKLVATAQDAEARVIKAPTGCQDYWGALRGGINVIHFPYGGVKVETSPSKQCQDLNNHLLLCYSGQSRASALNNWEIFKRVFDGDKSLIDAFNQIGILAEECALAIKGGNLAKVMSTSEKEWQLRKKLWPNIATEVTENLDQAARKAGAYFSRVCGAGGGGVMAVFVAPEKKLAVKEQLTKAGGRVLDASVSDVGLTVTRE